MSPSASVALVEKSAGQLAAWLPVSTALYRQARIDAGDTPAEAAAASSASQERFFPGGVPAEGQRVFTITVDGTADHADGADAGWLWIGPYTDGDDWWIWDIEVHEAFRRRGIAEAALRLAEDLARGAGIAAIGLNVFGGNDTARRLYDRVGYHVTSVHMRKAL